MIADFKKKQKETGPERFFSSNFIKILFLVIIIFLFVKDIEVWREKRKFDKQVKALEDKIMEVKDKNSNLEEAIARSDDKEYIEKIAREELDLQIQGEKVVTFVAPQNKEEKKEQEENNFFKVWTGWFSGIWSWLTGKR